MIVDDDDSVRTLVAEVLSPLDHEVIQAPGGQEALDLIEQDVPDLIVLDLMMPRVDGWEVLRQLRKRGMRGKTRVVMLTAKASESDYLQGWKLGVDEYLTKPFEIEELTKAVTDTLLMSHEDLQQKRAQELEKANLLSRIESAFKQS